LFTNTHISKKLSLKDVKYILEWMASKEGGQRGEWLDGAKGKDGGEYWVYWKRPEEWARLVEEWVEATGQKGSVLTVFELLEGEGSAGEEFHGMDAELLQKSLQVLVKRGRAQVFGSEDQQGVKFF
jgi:ESCRT-II complex subunit VPS25